MDHPTTWRCMSQTLMHVRMERLTNSPQTDACMSQTLRSGRLPACMLPRADLAKTLAFPGSHLGGACSFVLSCSSAPVFCWWCFFVLFSFVHFFFSFLFFILKYEQQTNWKQNSSVTKWTVPVVPPVVQDKLVEMEKSVANPDLGSDLRGVKELLKKHQVLEMDLGLLADTMQTIVEQGKEMAKAGHFNSAGILSAVEDFNKRWSVGVSCSAPGADWAVCGGQEVVGGMCCSVANSNNNKEDF